MATPLQDLTDWVAAIFAGCGMDAWPRRARGGEPRSGGGARRLHPRADPGEDLRRQDAIGRRSMPHPSIRLREQRAASCIAMPIAGSVPAVGMRIVDATSSRRVARAADRRHQRYRPLAALGIYALRAAEAGMFASSCRPRPASWACPALAGAPSATIRFAFGSPMPDGPPLVLDVASAAVARSRILRAAREGQSIPEGWGLDLEGRPTTDPALAMQGAQLPMAGHKGLGIAMMVECLAGSLSGVRPPAAQFRCRGQCSCQCRRLHADHPSRLAAIGDGYLAHVADWIGDYRQASAAGARYPGERAAAAEAAAWRDGIELSAVRRDELTALGAELGVRYPF